MKKNYDIGFRASQLLRMLEEDKVFADLSADEKLSTLQMALAMQQTTIQAAITLKMQQEAIKIGLDNVRNSK